MTSIWNVTQQPEMHPLKSRRLGLVGLLVWWVGIAGIAGLGAAALVDVEYPQVVYVFVVVPAGAILLFPAAWAANRWLTPMINSLIRRS